MTSWTGPCTARSPPTRPPGTATARTILLPVPAGRLAATPRRRPMAATRHAPRPGRPQPEFLDAAAVRRPRHPSAAGCLRDPRPADRPGGSGLGFRFLSARGRGPATRPGHLQPARRQSPPVGHQRHTVSGAAHLGRVPHPAHRRPSLPPAEHRERSPVFTRGGRCRGRQLGGVQPRRAHAGQRRFDARPAVGYGRPAHPGRSAGPDRHQRVGSVAFSPDGHTLASGEPRRHGAVVGYHRPGAPGAARPAPDRPHRRGGVGGVQPRRAHPGHRQRRRTVRLWNLTDPAHPARWASP